MHPPHHYRNISFTCTHSAEDWVAIVTSVERYIEHLVWSVPFWNAHPLRPSSEEMRVQTKDMDYTASSNPHLALQIFLLLSLSALTCHYRILLAKVIKRLLRWVFWSMQSCNFLVMVLHDLHFLQHLLYKCFLRLKFWLELCWRDAALQERSNFFVVVTTDTPKVQVGGIFKTVQR